MEYTPKRFHCPACGFEPAENVSEKEYAHCPRCLTAVHEADSEGYECGGKRNSTAETSFSSGVCIGTKTDASAMGPITSTCDSRRNFRRRFRSSCSKIPFA